MLFLCSANVNFGGAAAYAGEQINDDRLHFRIEVEIYSITDIQNVENEYTGFSFPKTVYFDIQASNYQVLLHEIGHNLGQAHSGKDGASYGDRTCWMGSHTYW